MAVARIGRIYLQGPDGKVHVTALYDLPAVLREPVLHVNGGIFQQVGQTPSGTWIYRYDGPLGGRPSNPDVTDFRNTESPDWDGPPVVRPPATMQDVATHFATVCACSPGHAALDALHAHFLAALMNQPYSPDVP